MDKRLGLTVLVFALFGGLFAAALFYQRVEPTQEPNLMQEQVEQPQREQPQREQAHDFTVYDGNGNTIRLTDLIGKPVIVNVWATWCGPCRMEMPGFDSIYQKAQGEVHILMVNAMNGDTMRQAQAFVDEQGYSFPVYYDADGDVAQAFGLRAYPTTIFIDAEGKIVYKVEGAMSEEALVRHIVGMSTVVFYEDVEAVARELN